MGIDKELLSQYGEACIALEIAQNRYQELKRKIAESMREKEMKDATPNG